MEAPILAYPHHPEGKIRITSDGSGKGLGSILEQSVNDEPYRPLAYASRTLSDVETRYTVTEIECLGIVFAFNKSDST